MDSLGTRFTARGNNFDALRLGAALTVLVSHAYSLTGAPWEPISTYLHYGYGGTLAVAVFFVISGFLVARSIEVRDLTGYIAGRALRIIPGLACVTLVETFVIAPLFYEGRTADYFGAFALNHLYNIFVFGEDPAIPGVFSRLPFPYVNGSLWTLPVETLFYLLLPFLALAASNGRRWIILLVFALSLVAEPLAGWFGMNDTQFGGFIFRTVRSFSVAQFSSYFLAGVCAWAYRDRIPATRGHFVLALLLLFAARDSLAGPWALKLCLPYVILWVGLHGEVGTRLKHRVGDLSYGVYLFSYPLTNAVIALGDRRLSPEAVIAFATPAILAAAWLSWRLVERPALAFKAGQPGGVADPGTGRIGALSPAAAPLVAPLPQPPKPERSEPPNGNFMLLRLAAIGLVIYGNGYLLTGAPVSSLWGAPIARIGLDVLFAVSGYLAMESWARRPQPLAFLRRRALRLFPGLVLCVLATVLVIGVLATSLPVRWYLLNGMTIRYLGNAMLVPYLWLPGVFQGQQWTGTVNPMLWTLLPLLLCWLTIPAAARVPARYRALVFAAAAIACIGTILAMKIVIPDAAYRVRLAEVLLQLPFFFLAAMFHCLQGRFTGMWRADVAILLFAANWIVATWLGPSNLLLEWVSLPYMAVFFGRQTGPVIGRLGYLGNPSFGFFLYAFPIQQLIVARWPELSHPVLACAALSLAAGYLSWYLAERPALLLDDRGWARPWRIGVLGR